MSKLYAEWEDIKERVCWAVEAALTDDDPQSGQAEWAQEVAERVVSGTMLHLDGYEAGDLIGDDDALERAQVALARFLFPGYCVPRYEMARAVRDALAGGDWLANLPARRVAVGDGPSSISA